MGAYKYIKNAIRNARSSRNQAYRERLIKWRKEGAVVRTENPYNIPSARKFGYKAANGFVVARVKMDKGRRKRPKPAKGRSARH
ncbi:MAG: 50S ribosomal protein L15e, partial [Candidatus ainarchaeum sp.]|nr:50S ribosomal protein L15e [Candidatus ainarchaeum sp.]